MRRDQGISHRRKRAFTAVFLVVSIVSPAAAQRRLTLTPTLAQNPGGSTRQSSGDDGMNGLDKALRNAAIDSETGKNIKTIVNFVPDDARADRMTLLTASLNKLANAPDRQSAQAALLDVGGAVAGAAVLADWHIHNDYAPKYANDRAGNIAKFVEAITPILKRTGAGYTEALIRNAEEKGGGMLWRGTESFLAKSMENSRTTPSAAQDSGGARFVTEPDPALRYIVDSNPGAEEITKKLAVIETNSNPDGALPDTMHLRNFSISMNIEIGNAQNRIPGAMENPHPSPYVTLAQDIAIEALKFSGTNLEALKKVTAELTARATKADGGTTRNVTPEDVGGILEQLRHGSPPEAAQAKAVLRAWLQESVGYQLAHSQKAGN